jgi:selenocysteine lyase/cysteine desulfurase
VNVWLLSPAQPGVWEKRKPAIRLLNSDLVDRNFFADFPGLAGRTYLNSAAESLFMASHEAALLRYAQAKALGEPGRPRFYAVEDACRRKMAGLLGVAHAEIAFVGSTSRGTNAALHAIPWQKGDNLVVNDLEFPTLIYAARHLERRSVEVRLLRHRDGALSLDDIAAAMDHRTRLVGVSAVSFLSGFRWDLEALAGLVHDRGALLLVDAAQALGAVPVPAAQIDFTVACTFKWLLGCHGLAVLCVHPRVKDLLPDYVSWKGVRDQFAPDRLETYHPWEDARRFEEGMPNYPALFVLENALDYLAALSPEFIAAKIERLASRAVDGLHAQGWDLLTPEDPSARAGIVSFREPSAKGIVAALRERNVFVWGGEGRVRLSAHVYNSEADIDRFLTELGAVRPI